MYFAPEADPGVRLVLLQHCWDEGLVIAHIYASQVSSLLHTSGLCFFPRLRPRYQFITALIPGDVVWATGAGCWRRRRKTAGCETMKQTCKNVDYVKKKNTAKIRTIIKLNTHISSCSTPNFFFHHTSHRSSDPSLGGYESWTYSAPRTESIGQSSTFGAVIAFLCDMSATHWWQWHVV